MVKKNKEDMMIIGVITFAIIALLIIVSSYVGSTGQAIAQIQTDMISFFHNANVITVAERSTCNKACGGDTCILAMSGNTMLGCGASVTGLTCVCTSDKVEKVETIGKEEETTNDVNYKPLSEMYEKSLNYLAGLIKEYKKDIDLNKAYDGIAKFKQVDLAITQETDKTKFVNFINNFEQELGMIEITFNQNDELPIIKDEVYTQLKNFIINWEISFEQELVPKSVTQPEIDFEETIVEKPKEVPTPNVVVNEPTTEEVVIEKKVVLEEQPKQVPESTDTNTNIMINSVNLKRNELLEKVDLEFKFTYTNTQRASIKNMINYEFDDIISSKDWESTTDVYNKWLRRLE
jgi:hypothetical protein